MQLLLGNAPCQNGNCTHHHEHSKSETQMLHFKAGEKQRVPDCIHWMVICLLILYIGNITKQNRTKQNLLLWAFRLPNPLFHQGTFLSEWTVLAGQLCWQDKRLACCNQSTPALHPTSSKYSRVQTQALLYVIFTQDFQKILLAKNMWNGTMRTEQEPAEISDTLLTRQQAELQLTNSTICERYQIQKQQPCTSMWLWGLGE